jgi:protein-S-isoprenylcysteine O-methyltransferase Ste14
MNSDNQENEKISRVRLAVESALGLFLFFALFLFLPAGSLAWKNGWLFMLIFSASATLAAIIVWRVNPEIFAARSRFHKGTKRWDMILLCFLLPPTAAIFPVAALDDARFHGSDASLWVIGIGYILLLVGIGLGAWAQAVNKFFEPSVRIQTDRGHQVIDTGPYAIVRHPGYVSAISFFAGIALCLGSLWALIPAGLSSSLLILRTRWEDQTLKAELAGYKDYSERVRFKLIPGVW